MKRHLISFLKSPIGYLANAIASVTQYLPRPVEAMLFDWWLVALCETFCLADGVQDDPLF